jgi:hypothetical protein
MRWTAALLVLGVAAGCGGPSAAASCVGPTLAVAPAQARVGQEVVVTVDRLHEGCNDYTGADEERALTDVPVGFVQDAVRVPLGTVSGTGDTFAAQLTVRVPAQATPGPARVVVGNGSSDVEWLTAEFTVAP